VRFPCVRWLIVTTVVVLSSCQAVTPPVASSPTAGSTIASPTSPSASPTPASAGRPFAVISIDSPNSGASHYTIWLVGLDGHVASSTTAASGGAEDVPFPGTPLQSECCSPAMQLVGFLQPAQPQAGVCCGVFLPFISVSNSRVYFPDGDTGVRFLAPDGTTGMATSVPNIKGRARAVFSVSPDDRRIAVSVFDWSTRPMSLRIYVEDLTGGANHVEIFSSTSRYEWPVGWHDGKLVLAVSPTAAAHNPYGASWYHLVDPLSADRLATLGGPTCQVVGALSPAGTACYELPGGLPNGGGWLKTVDWTGTATAFYRYANGGGLDWAPLSPDGNSIYIEEGGGGPLTSYGVVRRDGSKTALTLQPCAVGPGAPWWLDDRHLLYHSPVQDQCGLAILDVISGSEVKVLDVPSFWGSFVGRIPGGL
jgi:hypothetical protein